MARKMTKAEKISKTPIDEIFRLKGEEGRKKLINYVTTLRSSYKRRVGSFARNGLVSHAQIALERQTPKSRPVKLTEMSRNQLLFEFYKYAEFFNSATATAEGIRKVNREQDIRIFGKDNRGLPKRTMTTYERTIFWDTYEEYINQYSSDVNQAYSSESIQQSLADAMFGYNKFSSGGLIDLLGEVRLRLQESKDKESLEDVPNTFSGRRSSFDW